VSNKLNYKAVDFFCGGGGMSYGMQQAGIEVLAGIDYEPTCKETYEANIKNAEFILADVFNLSEKSLQKKLNLKKNDNELILIGCSPCQFWSIINTDKNKSEKSKNLLVEFRRFVEYLKPGYVVVENVPGVLRKKEESGLASFINWLEEERNGYKVHFDVHNVSEYGVAQNRKRFTLIANRVSNEEIIPLKKAGEKLAVKDVIGTENGFPRIDAGHKDDSDFLHTVPSISQINKERLRLVKKDGGNRFGFAKNKRLQLKCFVDRDDSFKDTFGRLWWNKPSPTITTKFSSISNGRFVHPDEDRALSLREGASLQSFPKSYKFYGSSVSSIARIIGNAVPPEYAKQIGLAILTNTKNARRSKK
jgi:DNA (cytosine-5)-methyltransferase 1